MRRKKGPKPPEEFPEHAQALEQSFLMTIASLSGLVSMSAKEKTPPTQLLAATLFLETLTEWYGRRFNYAKHETLEKLLSFVNEYKSNPIYVFDLATEVKQ